MPNGHGGVPWFGSPVFLLVLMGVGYFFHDLGAWIVWVGYGLAAVLGWRLAFHLMMWGVTDYGGAHAKPKDIRRARRRYVAALVICVPLAVVAWYFLTK